ncbi:MAG TPA: ABC transporter permease subunit [Candidatus Lambdaproteobacteria bacterium]|jgi:sn-glycerol 3-phosphate transport system permease protein|nr:ABC transporter permease subunit [Candidatus Lambdaproteobacteria bacterium]
MKRVQFKSKFTPFLFVAPQLAIVLVFLYWPILQTFSDAFTVQDAFGFSKTFVWFDNFAFVITDPAYIRSLKFTLFYIFVITLVTGSIGLLLAVQANSVIHGKSAYKTLLIWPYAIAPAVVGVSANYFFSERLGLLYGFFNDLWGFNWMENVSDAYIYVIFAGCWKQISANFIFFLAGLQNIEKSVIEASSIDCKSSFRRFWTVTFPLLMPTTFFLIIINITYAFFETLGIIDTTTIGAPSGETKTLVYKAYIDGFKGLDLGSAGAQSIIMMIIVLVITIFQFRFIEGKVHYN